jgi:hypothetical protein
LTDGAVRLLWGLHSWAGGSEILLPTKTLATALRVSTATIRGWQDELAKAGYLSHSTDLRTGAIRYTLLPVTPAPGWDAPFRELSPPERPPGR